MPKQIKDPVHGYIEVPTPLVPLLDTEAVQRLRYIKQLGFIYLVYPGANHTRFEHSLGAMHLASLLARQLDLSRDDTFLVCAAALLHDIGHGPFSHASERLRAEYGPFSHDEIGPYLITPEISDILEENGTDPKEIAGIVAGNHRLAEIIHGDLDVDRMDYLLRDAHYTGVPYGNLDASRLIQSLVFTGDGLAIKESGVAAAESLLIARTLMGPSVYYHHVGRIAEEMFLLAGRSHFADSTPDSFMRMDDVAGTTLLMNSPSAISREMMHRIWRRDLYKRAVYTGREQLNMDRLSSLRPEEKTRMRRAIAETAGVPEEKIILDIPPIRKEMRMMVQVQNQHDLVAFEEIIPLLSMMNATRQGQWRLGVYAPADVLDKVGDAAREVLSLRRATKQDKLPGTIV
ncbi:MAG: HD domain-containing protein [Methanocorpusculum sp.]|uniref:HD domain-containing protein n=1 Tax=Methanocorpusculum sp. TaxID=2058474 RepID=UPI002720DFEC|nr:HD domain-containing protein [Methanocorpusculum sp.]MDO9522882.1 HD domain-containing protein [Methanocorpusculum sp.]